MIINEKTLFTFLICPLELKCSCTFSALEDLTGNRRLKMIIKLQAAPAAASSLCQQPVGGALENDSL